MCAKIPSIDWLPGRTIPMAVPCLLKGIGKDWLADGRWSLSALAARNAALPVTLVCGNREREATVFIDSTWGDYLAYLQHPAPAQDPPRYLKEFNLFREFPDLFNNMQYQYHSLFPAKTIKSHGVWIGPAGSTTGMHRDYLDNISWLAEGEKRFYLAPPGSIEGLGRISKKYDRWAQLANIDIEELATLAPNHGFHVYVVDLTAGDCLFLPKGWWHQVENISSSVFVGGFFGPRWEVLAKFVWTQTRQGLHQIGLLGRNHCTCCKQRTA